MPIADKLTGRGEVQSPTTAPEDTEIVTYEGPTGRLLRALGPASPGPPKVLGTRQISAPAGIATPSINTLVSLGLKVGSPMGDGTVTVENPAGGRVGHLAVEGNITVGGSVDGRNVADDGDLLDAAAAALTAHTGDTGNPHGVTAAQAGAATTGALAAHTGDTENPHGVTAAQAGAATTGALAAHTGDGGNPHGVTMAQVTPQTTKGDLILRSATAPVRLAVGANGKVLEAASGEATGTRWGDALMDGDFVASDGLLLKTGAGAFSLLKVNLAASAAPTVNDDSGQGYGVGSIIVDTTNTRRYVCLDPGVGAAKWYALDPGRMEAHVMSLAEFTPGNSYVLGKAPYKAVMARANFVTLGTSSSVVFNIEIRNEATPGTTGTNIWTANKTANTSHAITTAFDVSAVAQYQELHCKIVSVGGTVPDLLRIGWLWYVLTQVTGS